MPVGVIVHGAGYLIYVAYVSILALLGLCMVYAIRRRRQTSILLAIVASIVGALLGFVERPPAWRLDQIVIIVLTAVVVNIAGKHWQKPEVR